MKKYFDTNGREFTTPPDPYKGRSPMHNPDGSYNDAAFRAMGGRIEDDGTPTPEQSVFCSSCSKTNTENIFPLAAISNREMIRRYCHETLHDFWQNLHFTP